MKKHSIAILWLLMMLFWSALVFHLVPSGTGGWSSWSVSIAFAALPLALALVAAVHTARQNHSRKDSAIVKTTIKGV